jgi:hypothetical protein
MLEGKFLKELADGPYFSSSIIVFDSMIQVNMRYWTFNTQSDFGLNESSIEDFIIEMSKKYCNGREVIFI